MYCKKCGSINDNDAVYCKKCGTLLESEDVTAAARREVLVAATEEVYRIGPTLKFVKAGYLLCALLAILIVVLLSAAGIAPIISVVLGLSLFLIPAYFHLRQRLISYSVDRQCIEVDSGLIARTTRNIPLTRIQDVTVSASVLQRLLGFGDVVIDNASDDGGKVIIKNIDAPREYADMLLQRMRQLEK